MPIDEKILVLETVECEICLKEIPVSEAKTDEASDYVYHFCGIECYARWRALAVSDTTDAEPVGAVEQSKKSVP